MSESKTPMDGSASRPQATDSGQVTPESEAGIPSITQPRSTSVSRKGIFAVALLAFSMVAVSSVWISRTLSGSKKDDETSKRTGDRPIAAAADPRRLDMTLPMPASTASPGGRMIPAIVPLPEDARAEPIPVRRSDPQRIAPEDAPAVLLASRTPVRTNSDAGVRRQAEAAGPNEIASGGGDPLESTRRNLDAYQHQLQGLLATLTKSTDIATKQGAGGTGAVALSSGPPAVNPPPSPAGGLFGGQLQPSATPRAIAGVIGNRSLTLPKGTAFTCALKTRIVSAASGFVSCQVQRNVYSEDGRVLLIERGSHMDGEYRIASVRPGTVRIPVLWTRIRTPNAVTVDIESPGTGPLGESGVDGYVDNRWVERIGAAMLLSLIDDSVKLIAQNQSNDSQGSTVVFPSTTSNTSKLAEKVLDSTINIPPLIYQNQGGIVGIYVARDVDFSSVYELKAVQR